MKAVKKTNSAASFRIETLEDRQMMATDWGAWPTFLGQDKVVQNYPWLTGGNFNVAVIDKGINYWHSALGGDRSTGTKSPRIVNVWDYRDNDNDPFPSESEAPDVDPSSAHGTGVAGILISPGYTAKDTGYHQGVLQTSKLYNIRTNRFDSQETIRKALQWVVDNHEKYHITAINLTDFIGTGAATPVYDAQVKALWEAGVFIATPVANDWQGDPVKSVPKWQPIGYPAKSPYVFGTGGLTPSMANTKTITGVVIRPQTQRGQYLDLLGPAQNITIPYYTPSKDEDVIVNGWGLGNSWGTPHVVGTAVLLQQIDPTITPAQIMQILQDSGAFVADPDASVSGIAGYKRLDMYAAVQMAYNVRDDIYDQGKGGDDDFAHAGRITLDGNGVGTIGNLKLLLHDHDYFKFTVTNPGDFKVAINYGGSSGFPGGQLLDANGNVVATIGQGGITGRLVAGDYYVHLYDPTESLNGTYSITVNTEEPQQPPPSGNGYAGENGTTNAVLFDGDNNLNMAWFDSKNQVLKFARRNAAGVWGTTQIIDNTKGAGNYLSMAMDSQGRPAVAYYDATNGDLKYAKYNGSSWDVQTVDARRTTGYYPSLKFDRKDNPYIAYFYKTAGDLRLATNVGNGWTITAVDTKGDVGRYPSLAANPVSGRWAIAYEATGAAAFKYAGQNKKGTWGTEVIDSTSGGGYVSLAFDGNARPAFTYYHAKNGDLRMARHNGSAWSKQTVAAKFNVGLYNSLFFDGGQPVVYYFNKSKNTLHDARWNGSGWDIESVATGGGRHGNVALDNDGFETFSWYDDASGDILVGDFL